MDTQPQGWGSGTMMGPQTKMENESKKPVGVNEKLSGAP